MCWNGSTRWGRTEEANSCLRFFEQRGNMGVAGKHQHLAISRLISHELHQCAGCSPGSGVVKVDQRIIHHNRQDNAVLMKTADQSQPQRQKDLFTGAPTEPLGIPDRASRIVDIQSSLVNGCGNPDVTAVGQLFEPV